MGARQGSPLRQQALHPPHQDSLAVRKDDEAWRWHERYGHLLFDALHRLSKHGMARGLLEIDHVAQFCDTCVITKHRRAPFTSEA